MWKWVVRDYFAAFRGGKSKEGLKSAWWSIWYLGIFYPLMNDLYEDPKCMIIYATIAIPIIFGVVSGSVHSMALPKVMYLCPLKESVRKEYIEKSCIFRIFFVSLLGTIGAMALWISGLCDGVTAGVSISNIVAWAVLSCGFDHKKIDDSLKERFNTKESYMVSIIEAADTTITLISAFGVACALCWDTPVYWWVKWIFVGVAVFLQVPLTVRLLKNWNMVVERAASYEKSFL